MAHRGKFPLSSQIIFNLAPVRWGVYAPNYFTGATVVNKAISGRSARSFTREGRWTEVQNLLKSGDFVVIEFGHNDGGSPSSSDRAAVGGEGDETQTVTLSNGTKEVVHTFPWYAFLSLSV